MEEDKVETIEGITETTIDIETKRDIKRDIQPHNGKKIDRIIVSQDLSYAVTYSREDSSIVGWSVKIKEIDLHQDFDIYFELKGIYCIYEFVLYQNILLYRYYEQVPHYRTYTVSK